jgi:hypothetical protein
MAVQFTYVPIATQTLGSATASVTFSSIPSTYQDLVLVCNAIRSASAVTAVQLNGDTANNYSQTLVAGNGTSAVSSRNTSVGNGVIDYTANTTNPSTTVAHFLNYANTNTYKTFLSRANNASDFVGAYANLWRSTAAISSINIFTTPVTFNAGSTFTLYGIASA